MTVICRVLGTITKINMFEMFKYHCTDEVCAQLNKEQMTWWNSNFGRSQSPRFKTYVSDLHHHQSQFMLTNYVLLNDKNNCLYIFCIFAVAKFFTTTKTLHCFARFPEYM